MYGNSTDRFSSRTDTTFAFLMKVLISAIACHPTRGSEAHVGWSAVRALSRDHDLWVLAHGNDRPAIEEAVQAGELSAGVRFYYHHDKPHWWKNRTLSRIKAWRDYEQWSRSVEATARRLEAEVGFDVVHHVTLASWRVPCRLWRLGIPFVWGPLGGAEKFPLRLLSTISPTARVFEMLRILQGTIAFHTPAIRSTARMAAVILSGTPETTRLLRHMTKSPVYELSAAFFNQAEAGNFLEKAKDYSGTLQLFAGGEIEGRKGFAIALDGLALAKRAGLGFHYFVGGSGQEEPWLRQRIQRLGLEREVSIGSTLSGSAYADQLKRSHLYLLPSLRDSAGLTLMEAMLAGCVPVVADCGGPGWIVTAESGYRIEVGSARQMSAKIAESILRINADRPHLAMMGDEARKRICEHFDERSYIRSIASAYKLAVGSSQ